MPEEQDNRPLTDEELLAVTGGSANNAAFLFPARQPDLPSFMDPQEFMAISPPAGEDNTTYDFYSLLPKSTEEQPRGHSLDGGGLTILKSVASSLNRA